MRPRNAVPISDTISLATPSRSSNEPFLMADAVVEHAHHRMQPARHAPFTWRRHVRNHQRRQRAPGRPRTDACSAPNSDKSPDMTCATLSLQSLSLRSRNADSSASAVTLCAAECVVTASCRYSQAEVSSRCVHWLSGTVCATMVAPLAS